MAFAICLVPEERRSPKFGQCQGSEGGAPGGGDDFLLALLYSRGRPEDDSADDDPDIEDHPDERPALGCYALRGVIGAPNMWAESSEKRDWRWSIVLNG